MDNRTNPTILSTGQMLDILGPEDTAINQDGFKVAYNRKGDLLMWPKKSKRPKETEGNQFFVYFPWIKKDKWVIIYD